MCEVCEKLEADTKLWENESIAVTQNFDIILKEHRDDCSQSEWKEILEAIKRFFQFSNIAYEGHDSDHFYITIHKMTGDFSA